MGEFGPWHILIVAAVFVLLFGYKRLPDATRSIGRSMRIFKAETKGLRDDGDHEPRAVESGQSASAPVATPPPAASSQPAASPEPHRAPVEARVEAPAEQPRS